MVDYEGYDYRSEVNVHERVAYGRNVEKDIYGGGIEDFDPRLNAMMRSEREKTLGEIRRLLNHYHDLLNIDYDVDELYNILSDISRIEFYNAEALVFAAIFKASGQPIGQEYLRRFQVNAIKKAITIYDLYRYVRFLNFVESKK